MNVRCYWVGSWEWNEVLHPGNNAFYKKAINIKAHQKRWSDREWTKQVATLDWQGRVVEWHLTLFQAKHTNAHEGIPRFIHDGKATTAKRPGRAFEGWKDPPIPKRCCGATEPECATSNSCFGKDQLMPSLATKHNKQQQRTM
mmetsp:Transcript_17134/g.25867  ORF Transcript_17134/g.25867 Transcript_17134/m.25867 type:complete len:143 (+) Transcript_17134:80-508(+)